MKLLLVSTSFDHSLPLLESVAIRHGFTPTTMRYDDEPSEWATVVAQPYDVIYLRDPFNRLDFDLSVIEKVVDQLRRSQPGAYFVDHADTLDDLFFEDKWRQYEALSDVMPPTRLLEESEEFGDHMIAEPRISSRARGIAFRPSELEAGFDYIVQPQLEIEAGYRVMAVGGIVLPRASRRSSKTTSTKVKALDVEPLDDSLREFTESVYRRVPQLDLVGFDIVRLKDGSLRLLEVNRSCQFAKYAELAGINPADELFEYLTPQLLHKSNNMVK